MYLKILRGGKKGYDAKKLSDYLLRESASAELVNSNLFAEDLNDSMQVADAFDRHHSLHAERKGGSAKRIKRPLVHIIARAAPEDGELDARTLERISTRIMELLKLHPGEYPHVAQSHTDENGVRNHIHIIASRISTKGKVWYGRREGELCWQIKTALEKEFSLTRTQTQKEFEAGEKRLVSRSEPENQMKKRGAYSKKEAIACAIQASLEDSGGNWEQFCANLRRYKIEAQKIERASGHHGIVFELEGVRIAGSSLGRGFSFKKLQQSLTAVRKGHSIEKERPGLKVDLDRLEGGMKASKKNSSRPAKYDFDKSLIGDLRKIERGRYPDLSKAAGSVFRIAYSPRFSVLEYILCLLITRSMVNQYKERELRMKKSIRHERSRAVINRPR